MGHTTIPHPAPFRLWATALLGLVAVAVAVLLVSSLSATTTATPPAGADDSSGTTTSATQATPCGLPWAVARAEGLDPRSCSTPREPVRTTGPR